MPELAAAPPEPRRLRRSRAATRQAWADRLARFPHAGLNPAQFCAREGVSLPSFYAWRRRLAAATAAAPEPPPGPDSGPRLLPVRLQAPGAAVEVVLPGGAVLRLLPGCDLAWVRSLVELLGGAPC
jgi:transposase